MDLAIAASSVGDAGDADIMALMRPLWTPSAAGHAGNAGCGTTQLAWARKAAMPEAAHATW